MVPKISKLTGENFQGKAYEDTDERRRIRSTFPIPLWSERRRGPALIPKEKLAWPPVVSKRQRYPFHLNKRSDDGAGRIVPHNLRLGLGRAGVVVGRVLGAGSQGLVFQITYGGRKMVAKTSSSIQPMIVSNVTRLQVQVAFKPRDVIAYLIATTASGLTPVQPSSLVTSELLSFSIRVCCQLRTMGLDGNVGNEANVGRKTHCPGQYQCFPAQKSTRVYILVSCKNDC